MSIRSGLASLFLFFISLCIVLKPAPTMAGDWEPYPVSGEKKLLVILVEFNNRQLLTDPETWNTKFFDTTPGALSVVNYYSDNSYGVMNITPVPTSQAGLPNGMLRIQLPMNHPDCASYGCYTPYDDVARQALEIADAAGYVDFASLDTDGDGYFQNSEFNLFMVIAGHEHSTTIARPSAHGMAKTAVNVTAGGIILPRYALNGEIWDEGSWKCFTGITVHELGHSICGLPDLYDTQHVNDGMGQYSVMAKASSSDRPVVLDAWSRQYLGWSTPREPVSGECTTFPLPLSAQDSSVKFVNPDASTTEYFLVENRFRSGWDLYLQASEGLLVQHVDITVGYSNNDGTTGYNDINAYVEGGHQGVMPKVVLYAGGKSDFGPGTVLDSRLYDGTATGLGVYNVSAQAETMTACYFPDPNLPECTLTHPTEGLQSTDSYFSCTIIGKSKDNSGTGIQVVQVSTDRGQTWSPASPKNGNWGQWDYNWSATGDGYYYIKARAVDNQGNVGVPESAQVIVSSVMPNSSHDLPGGDYLARQLVTLSSDIPATIYYTTDGTEPDTSSNAYAGRILIDQPTTLKYFAVGVAGMNEPVHTVTYNVNPVTDWTSRVGNSGQDCYDIAVDGTGNAYITGRTFYSFDGNLRMGADDIIAAKYGPDGSKIWTKQIGTLDWEVGTGIDLDQSGNIYLAGHFRPADVSPYDYNPLVIKLDPSGDELWRVRDGSTADDYATDISIDGSSNVFVIGYTNGGLGGNANQGGSDMFVSRYDAAGNEIWTKQIGTSADDSAHGIVVDGAGNIYIAGHTSGAFAGNSNAGEEDIFITRFDSNGNMIWTRQAGTEFSDIEADICMDSAGNIYISGYTSGAFAGEASAGGTDQVVLKYDSTGNLIWARQSGTSSGDAAVGICADGDTIFVAGHSSGDYAGWSRLGQSDITIVKYSSDGSVVWRGMLGGLGSDGVSGVRPAPDGSLYIAGESSGSLDGYDVDEGLFVMKLSGTPLGSTIIYPMDEGLASGTVCTITGTSSGVDGAGVSIVEVSTDGGGMWNVATDTSGDGSWSSWSYDWVPPSDGPYTLISRATDTNSIIEAAGASIEVLYDNTEPVSSISSPAEGTYLDGEEYTITGTASDALSGLQKVEISIDGGTWTEVTGTDNWSYAWGLSNEGVHSISTRATDMAGNVESSGTAVNVTVDINMPLCEITAPANGSLQVGPVCQISGTADDGTGSGIDYVEVSTDGANWEMATYSTGSWSYDWALTDDGESGILARATDRSGKSRTVGAGMTVFVDINEPTSVIAYPADGSAVSGSNCNVTINADDGDGTGVSLVELSVDGGAWQSAETNFVPSTLAGAGNVGKYASMAMDSNNNMHISYLDTTNDRLMYATNASGSWVHTTLDISGLSAIRSGVGTSIAVDDNGKVHISYAGYNNYYLKYATNVSGSWVYKTLDNLYLREDTNTSIAIDGNGSIHISYCQSGDTHLKYATNASGTWVCTTVDNYSASGLSTVIAIDSNNNVHIAYSRNYWVSGSGTHYELRYATNVTGSWVVSVLDNTVNFVGLYASLALDGADNAYISYYDGTNKDLKLATNASGSWVYSTLDSVGNVGTYTDIAVDFGNHLHISYYDVTDKDLKYATDVSGAWEYVTLDSDGDVGKFSSMALDLDLNPLICYYDATNADLKYISKELSSWGIGWDLLAETEGTHTLQSRATDLAGWVETPAAGNVVLVDHTPPSSAIAGPGNGSIISGTDYTVFGTADDGAGSGVDYVEVSIDGGSTWSAASGTSNWTYSWVLPAEGVYQVMVRATDRTGITGANSAAVSVTVDNVPAASAVTDPPDEWFVNGGSYTVAGTASDGAGSGVDYVEVSTDHGSTWATADGTTNWTYNWTYTADGLYEIKARAYDNIGNPPVESPSVYTGVDNTPATCVITTWGMVRGATHNIVGTANDFGSGVSLVEVSTDGGTTWSAANGTSNWTYNWTLPEDGVYELIARAYDIVGNPASNSASVFVTVDNTPAASVVTGPSDGSLLNGTSYTITGTADDGTGSGIDFIALSTDGGSTWNSIEGATNWTYNWILPTDGTYEILASANDNAGNPGTTSAAVTVTVDKTPPMFDLTSPSQGQSINGSSYTLTGTSSDVNGVDVVEIRIAGGNWETATGTSNWTYDWTLPADGYYSFEVRVTDMAGNQVGDPWDVYVDNTPATCALNAPAEGSILSGAAYAVTGTADDGTGSGLDYVEVSTDGGITWNTADGTTDWTYNWTLSTDGAFEVVARAHDNVGNTAVNSNSAVVLVDNTSAASVVTGPADGSAVNGIIYTVTGTADDGTGSGLDYVEVSTDGVNWYPATGTSNWTHDWTLPADGVYEVKARATDIAGNTPVNGASVFVNVDNSQPACVITWPPDNEIINGPTCTVTGSADDGPGSGVCAVEVSTDGGNTWVLAAGTDNWTYDWALPADGSYVIIARATDCVGNPPGNSAPVNVTVDNTPPALVVTSPTQGQTINGSSFSVTGTTADTNGVSLVEVSTDGANWYPATGTSSWTYDWTLPADGVYEVKARATDSAGNQNYQGGGSVSVTVDNSQPACVITWPPDNALINGQMCTLTGTADDGPGSGVCAVEVSTDDGNTWVMAAGTDNWAYDWALPADGSYVIIARATDCVGNPPGNSAPVNVTVDNTPPALMVTSPTQGQSVNGSSFAVTGTTADTNGVSLVEVSTDGVNWYPATGTTNWSYDWNPLPTNGTYAVEVRATDMAGNPNDQGGGPVSVTVDNALPGSLVYSPAEGECLPYIGAVFAYAYDNSGVGISGVQVSIDGGAWLDAELWFSNRWEYIGWTPPSDGVYTLASRAIDNLGNIQTDVTTITASYDTTMPSATITGPADGYRFSGDSLIITGTSDDGAGCGVREVNIQLGYTLCYGLAADTAGDGSFSTWECTIDVSTAPDGAYPVYVIPEDLAGNPLLDNGAPVDLGVTVYLEKAPYEPYWIVQDGSSSDDVVTDIVADADGNVVTIGYTEGSVYGEHLGGRDITLARYDRYGNTLWTKQFGTQNNDIGFGVTLDSANDIYITGYVRDTLPASGRTNPNTNADIFVMKYTPDGVLVWTRQFGTDGNDEGNDICTWNFNGTDYFYVTGYVTGEFCGAGSYNAGKDYFMLMLDPDGNETSRQEYGTKYDDIGMRVVSNEYCGMYVSGITSGDLDDPDFACADNTCGSYDAFLVKYDCTLFERLWTRQFQANEGDEYCYQMGLDSRDGYIYVGGRTTGDFNGNTNLGNRDGYLVKYDSDGNLQWTKMMATTAYDDINDLTVTDTGEILVTAATTGTLEGTWAGGFDIVLAKYLADGTMEWLSQYGTSSADNPKGVACGGDGSIYVGGMSEGALGGTNVGGRDNFVARFGPAYESTLTSTVTVPVAGATIKGSSGTYTVTGTATEYGHGGIDHVDVSTDGGMSWAPADVLSGIGNRSSWTFNWYWNSLAVVEGPYTVMSRITAMDAAVEAPSAGFTVYIESSGYLEGADSQIGTGGNEDIAGIVCDQAGNTYAVGRTDSDLNGLINAGYRDGYFAKYLPDGTLDWNTLVGTTAYDDLTDITIDGAGNLYIVGHSAGLFPGGGRTTPTDNWDVLVMKYDSGLNLLWTRQFGSNENDLAYQVAYHPSGYLYISGNTLGDIEPGAQNPTYNDAFVSKMDADGNLIWTKQFSSTGDVDDYGHGVAVDSDQGVYLCGRTYGEFESGHPNPDPATHDSIIMKLDADGNEIWRRQVSGTANEFFVRMAPARDEAAVYVVGKHNGNLNGEVNNGGADFCVIKYGADGNPIWTKLLGGPGYNDGRDIEVNDAGDVYVTGYSWNTFQGDTNSGEADVCVAKLSSTGNFIWGAQTGTFAIDVSVAIGLPAPNRVVVGGHTYGNYGAPNPGGQDTLLIWFEPNY